MAALDVEHVTVTFGATPVLADVSLTVASGEVVALLGPSGSGKTTLLKVIAGIVAPDTGRVLIDGDDVTTTPTHRRHVGMVFQDNQLFPHRSVAANVAFGLRMAGVGAAERRARSDEWLARVGLAGFGGRDVASLSGGEAKRVALARTLAVDPLVVLLDEPLTGLDRELHDRLAVDLAALLRGAGTTTILVTHDPDEAATVADRTAHLAALTPFVLAPSPNERGRVREIRAADTHDLRARVLRAGTPTARVDFDGDDDASTAHLAVERDGWIVAVSTWIDRPFPGTDTPAIQLRGMATEPDLRGEGLGAALLAAGIDRARALGVATVWARARSSAVGFYTANGFTVVGDEFVDDTTALPHQIVICTVPSGASDHPR